MTALNTVGDAKINYRFLVKADFSGQGNFRPLGSDTVWIKDPDDTVAAMTYAEFRAASRVLEKRRPLPDGKVGG